jgi:hypothetical protein
MASSGQTARTSGRGAILDPIAGPDAGHLDHLVDLVAETIEEVLVLDSTRGQQYDKAVNATALAACETVGDIERLIAARQTESEA